MKLGYKIIIITIILVIITLMAMRFGDLYMNGDLTRAYSIPNGVVCFVNGNYCKNVTCGLPGGCKATGCIGDVEYMGALRIKCININRS